MFVINIYKIILFFNINTHFFQGKVSQSPSPLRLAHLKWRRTIKQSKLPWMDLVNHDPNLVSFSMLK